MALSNLSIQSAVQQNGGRCRPNLSHEVLCSAKIGQILPIYHQEMIPGDSVDVHSTMFCRTLPLAVPSYVTLKYRTMSVFVPYHQVSDGVESYFANEEYFKGKGNRIPLLTQYYLREFYKLSDFSTVKESSVATADLASKTFDVALATSSNNTTWNIYTFTPLGRYVNKVFHLLGYRFGNKLPYATSTSGSQGKFYNALPLLSFIHAYNSFLSYAPKYNTSNLSSILETIKRSENPVVTHSHLVVFFKNLLLTYEESFTTTLWQNPESSTPGNVNPRGDFKTASGLEQMIEDAGQGFRDRLYTDYTTEDGVRSKIPTTESWLTAQQIRLILKYDQFFRRSNFAGSKDIEKIYSQFGVKIADYQTRYPIFLNESTDIVNIGDVTSQSDTQSGSTGAQLGSYAGKAIGDGNSGFKFTSNDYGMLFTFAWFAPKPLYYQGCDKENLRIDPFDFYTPQLDQSFMVPVLGAQISENMVGPFAPFGYAPLYSEYLYHNDIICGDFETFAGFDAWHFGRNLNPYQYAQYVAQSDFLIYMGNTGTEFERIFRITDPESTDVDSIYMTIHNAAPASRPMRDMTGKTGLLPGNVHVAANGNNVN